jgi:DNA-binding NtrC family response regulator
MCGIFGLHTIDGTSYDRLAPGIERALILCDGPEITPAHLPQDLAASIEAAPEPALAMAASSAAAPRAPSKPAPTNGSGLVANISQYEKSLIADALERNEGDLAATAKELKITTAALKEKVERYRIRG